jgi:hypothetical protein
VTPPLYTQTTTARDANGNVIFNSSTPVTFGGPDAAAALMNAGVTGAV